MSVKRLKDVNWNHLYCFYEIARAQSLKEASDFLELASSTISEQLKKLEQNFGRQLFHRVPKGLLLTREGEMLFEHCREVFEAGSRMLDNFTQAEIGGYPVTVGIEESLSHDIAIEFTSQYWDLFTPFGTVNTVRQTEHESLINSIIRGEIDWGISLKEPKRKSVDFGKIGAFNITFCCSEELFNKFKNPKDILRNIPLSLSSWDRSFNKNVLNYLKGHKISPKEFISSDHPDYIHKLCLRGRCVTFMADNPELNYSGIMKFQIDTPMTASIYAIWKKSDENMISIRKLKELVSMKNPPSHYTDPQWQIEVAEVSNDLLKNE